MSSPDPRSRTGRRPGDSGTRAAIAAAAGRQFAELGFDRTSLRSVAAEAGVDPALVKHYFGTKQALFVAVIELPIDPAQAVPQVFADGPEHAGRRLAELMAGVLEAPAPRRRLIGLVRAAASEPQAAALIRERLARDLFARIAHELDSPDAELRASLVASQVVGVVMARHVVGIEPLASMPATELAAALAPNLQHYLTGELASGPRGG